MLTQFKSKEEILKKHIPNYTDDKHVWKVFLRGDMTDNITKLFLAAMEEYHTQFSPPIEGAELYHWVKASERLPEQNIGIECIGRSKTGRIDNYVWDNMMKFHRPHYNEADELYEWLEKITPNKTLIEGKEEDESRTYTEQDILLKI